MAGAERALTALVSAIAEGFNRLELFPAIDPSVRPYFNRPFLVLGSRRFADACYAAIDDPEVARLPPGVGAVDQWVDNTDVFQSPDLVCPASDALYNARLGEYRPI